MGGEGGPPSPKTASDVREEVTRGKPKSACVALVSHQNTEYADTTWTIPSASAGCPSDSCSIFFLPAGVTMNHLFAHKHIYACATDDSPFRPSLEFVALRLNLPLTHQIFNRSSFFIRFATWRVRFGQSKKGPALLKRFQNSQRTSSGTGALCALYSVRSWNDRWKQRSPMKTWGIDWRGRDRPRLNHPRFMRLHHSKRDPSGTRAALSEPSVLDRMT